MDDIRCPECGHLNPPEAAFCQSCRALLTDRKTDGGEPVKNSDEDVPEWLQAIRARQAAEQGTDEPSEWQSEDDAGADSPDWLKTIRGLTDEAPTEDVPAPEETLSTEEPVSERPPEPAPEPVQDDAPSAPAEEEAEWLRHLSGWQPIPPAEDQPAGTPPESPLPEEPAIIPPAADEKPAPVSAFDFSGEERSEPQPAHDPTGSLTWLHDLEKLQQNQAASDAPAQPAVAPFDGDLPDWLSGERETVEPEPEAPAPEPAEDIEPVFDEDSVPAWLSSAMQDTPPEEAQPEPEAKVDAFPAEDLARANLPAWLAAQRPVEAVVPGPAKSVPTSDKPQEGGPLRGLRGVLPAAGRTGEYVKPAVYMGGLRVSDRQKKYAGIFNELLIDASTPKELPAKKISAVPRLVRMIVGMLLVLATLIPLAAGTASLPMPALFPQETLGFITTLAALPSGTPVLVVADYTAGLSGEIESTGRTALSVLQERGARLMTVSSRADGLALISAALPAAQPLGYIPGGEVGIQAFAAAPDLAASQGITSITQFGAILVITDDFDTARMWLEQAQPRMGSTPLLFITSAQLRALLKPYVQSGQAAGMIAGLADAAAFEMMINRPGTARIYWDAYQLGAIALVVVLVVGALAGAIRRVLRKKPTPTLRKAAK